MGKILWYNNALGSSERVPWTAEVRSESVTLTLLLDDTSLFTDKAFSFFFFLLDVLLALQSPHMLVPPCVEGMFKKVMPWSVGPSERFKGTPSHCNWGRKSMMPSKYGLILWKDIYIVITIVIKSSRVTFNLQSIQHHRADFCKTKKIALTLHIRNTTVCSSFDC